MCFIWLAPGAHQGRERKQQCCYFGDVFWQSDDYWFCQKHLQLFPLLWSKHCLHVKSPKNSNCGSCSRPTSTQAGAATHAHKRSSHPPAITISMKLKIVQPPPPTTPLSRRINRCCLHDCPVFVVSFLCHAGFKGRADGGLTEHLGGFGETQEVRSVFEVLGSCGSQNDYVKVNICFFFQTWLKAGDGDSNTGPGVSLPLSQCMLG